MIATRALLLAVALAATSAHAFVPPSFGKKTVSGVWAGEWSTSYGILKLTQQGKIVVGHYVYSTPPVKGEVRGEADGRKLVFAWEEGKGGAGSGWGRFELSEDSLTFKGTWAVGAAVDPAGTWEGTRVGP